MTDNLLESVVIPLALSVPVMVVFPAARVEENDALVPVSAPVNSALVVPSLKHESLPKPSVTTLAALSGRLRKCHYSPGLSPHYSVVSRH